MPYGIESAIRWWKQEQRQWYGWLNDQVRHEYALGHECDKNRISRQPCYVQIVSDTWVEHSTQYFNVVRVELTHLR